MKKKKVEKELLELRHKVHMMGELDTLQTLIARAYSAYGDRLAIVEKNKAELIKHTSRELCVSIYAVGTALNEMGLHGKHIAILGEGSFNWIVAFFAVACGVGISVPLDKELSDMELSKLMTKADCEAVFCSKTYFKTARLHMQNDDRVKNVFTLSGSCDDEGFMSIDELIKRGRELIGNGDRSYIEAKIAKDDIAAIVFTSGTTGANKGVMLSHYNFSSNVDGIIDTITQEATSFSVLPMNHVYELSCNIMTSIYMNAVIYINDSLRNILPNIQLFKPDAFNSVPLILEGIYNGIWAAAEQRGKAEALKKLVKLSNKLLSHGIDMRNIFFASIRKNFGNTFPTLVCGGAPSRLEHVTGLYSFGFNVYQGYGLTESSPTVTLNLHAGTSPESAGFAFPKAKFKIVDPDENGVGEIWITGDNLFKGYYKDEEATKASFEGEWFKTGDYGRTNEKHELFVVGRKKNLIILDNGKNVFPEEVESFVMEGIHYVHEVIAFEAVKKVNGKDHKIIAVGIYVEPKDFPDMSRKEIEDMVLKDVTEVSRQMSSYKRIQDVMVSFEEFPKTSTRKVVRQKVIDAYNNKNKVEI
ncbi:MAG: AMP-binding protein [Oscillospiraceae bacterium]|nr:AMP-binding protein [Oscillospiraceae bacterium]